MGKALSTPGDLTAGALAAVEAAAAEIDQPLADLLGRAESIGYATTVGLNALLTGTGAPLGLITTEGFEATLPVARAAKVAGLSPAETTEAVCWAKPPLLLSRQRIMGVPERIDAHGEVIRPLDETAAAAAIKALRDDGVTSYAVSLLWSVADPRHEVRIAELIVQIHPGAHVSLSSAVPRIGEYERTMTTVLDASTAPLVAEEIRTLAHALAERGFAGHLHVMQSSGSTCDADGGLRAVETLGSGPVAGLLASAELVQQLGRSEAIATDVGGTSFDVGLITGGEATMATRPMIGRWALAHPVVEVVSIGTGGGSLAWIDPVLGSLRVGPQSAGAQPGPACYRRGGTAPTLTDAAVTLGYLSELGQVLELDRSAAERVMEVDTTPGTIVDCLWPAGMSMGVTAAGQEVRTAVNICLSRMFDASDDPNVRSQILASCVSGSFTQTISGAFDDGRDFSAMLLDGLPGGSGARWGGDGSDTGGYLTSPAGLCTNIETNEQHYPVLYRYRWERPDSGGPGQWRGGVGVEHAYQLHRAAGTVTSTVFAHGQQPPTAAGVVGGEPGMQHTGVYERADGTIEVPPPKQVGELAPGDVYANLCGGGGGVGDPLDRDPVAVEHDVAEGLVTEAGAVRDYGVVIGDVEATKTLRASRRQARIERDPEPPLEEPPTGRRLSSTVVLANGHYLCSRCGHEHGPTNEPLVSLLIVSRSPVDERTPWPSARPGADRFELRRLYCPACAVQVDVQVALANAPFLETAELIED